MPKETHMPNSSKLVLVCPHPPQKKNNIQIVKTQTQTQFIHIHCKIMTCSIYIYCQLLIKYIFYKFSSPVHSLENEPTCKALGQFSSFMCNRCAFLSLLDSNRKMSHGRRRGVRLARLWWNLAYEILLAWRATMQLKNVWILKYSKLSDEQPSQLQLVDSQYTECILQYYSTSVA